ncbi:MAG: DUF262 domain-containing protein [Pseudanabaena sp. Salubria-1]|jgi:hypothetical protein|nr:DUF262 domain-containing protein [Pseudanabaena sp. Salubria-1]MCX5934324.1 DUF262 domain-containing protein [Pseudanabaena sp. LacPavin_0818_WC45_MAG_42_6]
MVSVFQQESITKAEEQIAEKRQSINYDTIAFDIETMVKYLEEDKIYVPDYHRGLIWDITRQSRFIESIFLGLPIPPLFAAEIRDSHRLEIIDGLQRVRSLAEFMTNKLQLTNLTTLDTLNGFSFNNFSRSLQRKFKHNSIRIIILSDTNEIIKNDMFNRINNN